MRGRRKKSQNSKVLHGTSRADRDNPPLLPEGVPECPDWLSLEAKEEWERLIPILANAGILNQALRGVLAHLCYLHAEIPKIAKVVRTEGWIVQSKDGLKSNPLAVLLTKYLTEYRHTAGELGINISGKFKRPEEPDPLEKFLTRK